MDELSRTDRRLSISDVPAPDGATESPCCTPLLAARINPTDAARAAGAFAALADPIRLRLLSLVAEAGEVCSCDLQEPLGRSQPTVSHHTRVLAEAGLITGERRGRWTWWSIVPARLEELRRILGG